MNVTGSGEKRQCPYGDKCYRKNPIHFGEMSHPHLENILIGQLDNKIIIIPEELDFECEDRLELLEQLVVLQKVMNKNRIKSTSTASECSTPKSSSSENSKKTKSDREIEESSNSLKDKVERHKDAQLQKRKMKLDSIDGQASNYRREKSPDLFSKRTSLSPGESPLKKPKCMDKSPQSKSSCLTLDKSSSSIMSKSSSSAGESSGNPIDRTELLRLKDQAIAKMLQVGFKVNVVPEGEFATKWAMSAPYHYFLTRVEKEKATFDQDFSITFPELLDISLGEIVDSLHINFMVDIGWLSLQYRLAAQNPKMTIFCGEPVDNPLLPPSIKLIKVEVPGAFGCHHSKVTVLHYKDTGIRIIVSTANAYADDWDTRTQGVWMSPHLPRLPESASPNDGESATGFKRSFLQYLVAYKDSKLKEWIDLVNRADFSSVNVFFVASVPGSHTNMDINLWGHRRLGAVLAQHAVLPKDGAEWPIIAQSSSIGNLGPTFDSWLGSNIVFAMSREKDKGMKSNPNFKFIYPSKRNYVESFDCKAGSCCLPYSRKSNEKQKWLRDYLYQWKADLINRTKAMPHIKCYTRISPDQTQIPWFMLTSANLSKGAWGSVTKKGASHYIMNYEAGVVFIPKFVIKQNTFPIKESCSPEIPVFRIPYDLPLTKYDSSDVIFVQDYLSD